MQNMTVQFERRKEIQDLEYEIKSLMNGKIIHIKCLLCQLYDFAQTVSVDCKTSTYVEVRT